MKSGRRLLLSVPHILAALRGRGRGAAAAAPGRRRPGASRWSSGGRAGFAAGPVAVVAVTVLLAGCASPAGGNAGNQGSQAGPAGVLRLGYLLELADAPALAGVQMGFFGAALGRVRLEQVAFASNAAEVAAVEHGQLDAAYMDPVAAVTVWQSSPGGLVRVVAGAASGGAELVVRTGITSARQLAGGHLVAPAGGAQQVALRYWLGRRGVHPPDAGRVTMTSAYLVRALRSGQIAGGWEPAPADTEMAAAGGRVLVNEASLWPGGRYATAVLVVGRRYLSAHRAAVTLLLKGQIQATAFLTAAPASAAAAVNQKLAAMQSTHIPPAVLARSFAQLTFTVDPLAASMLTEAQRAAAAGLLKPVRSLAGLYDLSPLNTLLRSAGERPVPG